MCLWFLFFVKQAHLQKPTYHPAGGVVRWTPSSGDIVRVLSWCLRLTAVLDIRILFASIAWFDHARCRSCCSVRRTWRHHTCGHFAAAVVRFSFDADTDSTICQAVRVVPGPTISCEYRGATVPSIVSCAAERGFKLALVSICSTSSIGEDPLSPGR